MSKRILVVEDDQGCEAVLVRAIKSVAPHAEIDCEDTAEQAIKDLDRQSRIFNNAYDLVVVDIFLAGKITGLDFWQRYREKYPDTPFLFVSSLPVNRFFDTIGKNTIAPAFLPKPFQVGEARQLIEGLLAYN